MSNYEQHILIGRKTTTSFRIAAWLAVAGIFSLPLFGAAAINTLMGLSIILFLLSPQRREYRELLSANRTALIGTILFFYMALSVSWADSDLPISLRYLSKYRELLLIPLFMLILTEQRYRDAAFRALYIALSLSLTASYLIHFQLIDLSILTDNKHSIDNRIYHGITMSFFSYMTLQLAFRKDSIHWAFAAIFIATVANLFLIENGRTGYLTVVALTGLFMWQRWGWKGFLITSSLLGFALMTLLWFYDLSDLRILTQDKRLLTGEVSLTLDTFQKSDIRAEFYILSTMMFLNEWIFGTGLGDFRSEYLQLHSSMPTYFHPAPDPHNEFLNIGLHSGIFGLLLFCFFIFSLATNKATQCHQQKQFQLAVYCAVGISCLFNSSIRSGGDGAFFMILIALFCGTSWLSPVGLMSKQANKVIPG